MHAFYMMMVDRVTEIVYGAEFAFLLISFSAYI